MSSVCRWCDGIFLIYSDLNNPSPQNEVLKLAQCWVMVKTTTLSQCVCVGGGDNVTWHETDQEAAVSASGRGASRWVACSDSLSTVPWSQVGAEYMYAVRSVCHVSEAANYIRLPAQFASFHLLMKCYDSICISRVHALVCVTMWEQRHSRAALPSVNVFRKQVHMILVCAQMLCQTFTTTNVGRSRDAQKIFYVHANNSGFSSPNNQ